MTFWDYMAKNPVESWFVLGLAALTAARVAELLGRRKP